MQLFHWTRNPSQAAKIAQRKEEIYDSIMNGMQPAEVPGCRGFLDTLRNYNVSVLRSSIRVLRGRSVRVARPHASQQRPAAPERTWQIPAAVC